MSPTILLIIKLLLYGLLYYFLLEWLYNKFSPIRREARELLKQLDELEKEIIDNPMGDYTIKIKGLQKRPSSRYDEHLSFIEFYNKYYKK